MSKMRTMRMQTKMTVKKKKNEMGRRGMSDKGLLNLYSRLLQYAYPWTNHSVGFSASFSN